MSKLNSHVKKDKWKWAITFISIILILGAVIGLFFALGHVNDTTKTLTTSSYSIGSVDTTTGKAIESRQNAYTHDMYKTQDMKIVVDEDATVSYKVVFYDEAKDFVSATDSLNADFDNNSIPATAKYFRVVVTPAKVDGENVNLTILNMGKYVGQITVTVAK